MDNETKEYIDTLEIKMEKEFRLAKKTIIRTRELIEAVEENILEKMEENRKEVYQEIAELKLDMNTGFEKMVNLIGKIK